MGTGKEWAIYLPPRDFWKNQNWRKKKTLTFIWLQMNLQCLLHSRVNIIFHRILAKECIHWKCTSRNGKSGNIAKERSKLGGIHCGWRYNQFKVLSPGNHLLQKTEDIFRFVILTGVTMESSTFLDVMLCILVEVPQYFGGTYCLNLAGRTYGLLLAGYFLGLLFKPWRWRQYITLKCHLDYIPLHPRRHNSS